MRRSRARCAPPACRSPPASSTILAWAQRWPMRPRARGRARSSAIRKPAARTATAEMWIFRLLFTLLVLIAVFWFATTVKLGKHTLYGHVRAIFATQEAKDLAEGAKDEAKKIRERIREENEHG